MKIGIVLSNTPGYSETFFNSKIKGLQANGVEVVLFVQSESDDFSLCRVIKQPKVYKKNPIVQMGLFYWIFISLIPFLPKVLRYLKLELKQKISFYRVLKNIYLNSSLLKQDLDWLHFGFATQAIGSELVAKAIGAKMAVSFRGFDINVYPLKHPNCYDLLWQQVDKVHSISIYLLEKAYDYGLNRKVPFKIITPAVVLDEIPNSTIKSTKYVQLVTIARLSWIKGVDVAIEAMKFLKEKNIAFEYHIIGSGSIKDIERYKFQAYEYNLKEHIKFHGKLSHQETLTFLSKADIYIQPSLNEGFCNAVLEAQAMGKLCVVSDIGGLPENIEDGKTGWLVPKSNPIVLADKILEIINLSDFEKQQISQNAIKRIEKNFTIEQQQKKFVNFYKG